MQARNLKYASIARARRGLALLAGILTFGAMPSFAQEAGHEGHDHAPGEHPVTERVSPPETWESEWLDTASKLAIQDGGRVKPLSTYASFLMLRLNGKRSVKLEDQGDRKIESMEWFLDLLLFPDTASDYETFIVQDSDALDAIGLAHADKRKRDRYSFNELRPGFDKLFEQAQQFSRVPEKQRSTVQQQVIDLANNAQAFMSVAGFLDFARTDLPIGGSPRLMEIFGGAERAPFSTVVEKAHEVGQLYSVLSIDPGADDEAQLVAGFTQLVQQIATSSRSLALLPPTTSIEVDPQWWSPYDTLRSALGGTPAPAEHVAILRDFEELIASREDDARLGASIASLSNSTLPLVESRGEYDKIPLEVRYYKLKLLYYGLLSFIGAFLACAFLMLRPKSTSLYVGANVLTFVGIGLLIAAIAMRCVIRNRPPVSTLYETVLFVAAVGCTVALITEVIGRKRIAGAAAATLGMVGLFLANGYEVLDKQDTMPSLVAVLDTNFWLATHVTSITMGYSAGILAALLGSIYLVARTLRIKRNDQAFYQTLGRMTYGVLAFGLFFSVVGTILGGIWANDSWGRFWGWDPKENGALLICLSQIAILHGRVGGYIRDFGTAVCAALGGTIVAFSWWGVNLLGVGLHSYGFTSGISKALWTYYGIQWGIAGVALIAYAIERAEARGRMTAMAPTELGSNEAIES